MDKLDAIVIVAFARCSMNITDAALATKWSRNGFLYRLDKIKRVTALDPRNFFDLGELYEIACSMLTSDEIEAI